MGVALVTGMHGHGGIAQHGFRAGSGDYQMARAIRQRVAHVPQIAVFFFGQYFQVGNGGVQHGIPIYQPLATVDQPLFEQPYEYLFHRVVESLVHGETLAGPVQRRPHAAQLASDMAAGLLLPIPDAIGEGIASQVVAGFALGLQLALHHHLRGDASVIGTRLPQGVVATHAMETGQGVHNGVLESVAHVQIAGDIGRRDHDAIGAALARRRKMALLFPGFVPRLFDCLGLVSLFHGC